MKIVAALLLLLAVPSLAQQRGDKPEPQPSARPVQQVTFGEDLIEGTLLRPDNEVLVVRTPVRFDSLLVLRKDFNDKIRESIDEL
jgi:hypothetical protein